MPVVRGPPVPGAAYRRAVRGVRLTIPFQPVATRQAKLSTVAARHPRETTAQVTATGRGTHSIERVPTLTGDCHGLRRWGDRFDRATGRRGMSGSLTVLASHCSGIAGELPCVFSSISRAGIVNKGLSGMWRVHPSQGRLLSLGQTHSTGQVRWSDRDAIRQLSPRAAPTRRSGGPEFVSDVRSPSPLVGLSDVGGHAAAVVDFIVVVPSPLAYLLGARLVV